VRRKAIMASAKDIAWHEARLNGKLGDWRAAGYSLERAIELAELLDSIMDNGHDFDTALRLACEELPPDEK
jgi:hypothetical protein